MVYLQSNCQLPDSGACDLISGIQLQSYSVGAKRVFGLVVAAIVEFAEGSPEFRAIRVNS